jgi:exodeoxyribonuclease-3
MSFTICSLNLNGARSAERRGFSRWLGRHEPDALCVQELRATPDQVEPALWSPAGYNTRWLSAEKKGYAGVGLYLRGHVDRYSTGNGLGWADSEGRCLRVDCGDVSVISLYLPSGSSSEERQRRKYEYLAHVLPWMRQLLAEKRKIAVCGDYNIAHTEIDIHDPRGNAKNSGFLPDERAWMTRLLGLGWVDVLRTLHPRETGLYSWWSNRGRARENDKGWRIDYVLASPELAACAEEAWIEKRADLSDHAPVWARFSGSLG